MAYAINDSCCPTDNLGWSSAGIYSFWDYYTKEILYIGLAVDLALRFKQHNGLIAAKENTCKYHQIQDYFSDKERLGYTILVQSPLSQPATFKNAKDYRLTYDIPKGQSLEGYPGEDGLQNIKMAEGQLIEAHNKAKGAIPRWNKMGGSLSGQERATLGNYNKILIDFSQGSTENPLVSRSTIRELSKNTQYLACESCLHGLRMLVFYFGMTFNAAVECHKTHNPFFHIDWDKNVVKNNYMEKQLVI